jgi:hypothetical protein
MWTPQRVDTGPVTSGWRHGLGPGITALAGLASVVLAGVAFDVWVRHQWGSELHGCPWGASRQGQPLLVGGAVVVAAGLLVSLLSWRRHSRRMTLAVATLTMFAAAALAVLLWFGIGANYRCFD